MIYAVADDGVAAFGAPHALEGAFNINLVTGIAADGPTFNRLDKMNIHGALMAVAWVLLLPFGSLIARHR